jgi:hypothetical protein
MLTLLQAKMTQQGKQIRVGAREGIAFSETGFYWLTVTGVRLNSLRFFEVAKPSNKRLPCSNLDH